MRCSLLHQPLATVQWHQQKGYVRCYAKRGKAHSGGHQDVLENPNGTGWIGASHWLVEPKRTVLY